MTPQRAGKLFFTVAAVQVAAVFLMGSAGLYFPWIYDIIPSTLISEGLLVLPALSFAMLTPASIPEMFPVRRVRVRTVLLTLVMLAGVFPAVALVNAVTMLFTENAAAALLPDTTVYPLWTMLLLVGAIGPVCEEFICRGYIYGCLRRSGHPIGAIVLSALIFGLIHLNLNQAAYATLVGVFLALLVRASGSLVPALAAHMAFNSFEVLLMYMVPDEAIQAETEELSEVARMLEMQTAGEGAAADAMLLFGASAGTVIGICVVAAGCVIAALCIHRIGILEEHPAVREESTFAQGRLLGIFTVLGLLISVTFIAWRQLYL